MKKLFKFLLKLVGLGLLLLALLIAGFVFWYNSQLMTYIWNQKLTLEVITPNGVKQAASTYEVVSNTHVTFGLFSIPSLTVAGLGEAVVMELDNGQFLFVLLGDALAMDLDTFRVELLGSADARYTDVKEEVVSKLGDMRISAPLARNRYPMFVTFDDLDDPASVKQVDPDDLAASFGPGYALKSLTLEITDEPVTRGEVEAAVGEKFFKHRATIHHDALSRGLDDPYFDSFSSQINRSHFITGTK